MGRLCILCARVRPNEAFGGRAERARICRWCRRLPRTRRDALKCEQEILGILEQSHVSDKNLARLKTLKSSPDFHIANLAAVVLDVSVATPYRRRRFRILARQHRDLLKRMEALGLILPAASQNDTDPCIDSAAEWDGWIEYSQRLVSE
jgi:hypothetical protein